MLIPLGKDTKFTEWKVFGKQDMHLVSKEASYISLIKYNRKQYFYNGKM